MRASNQEAAAVPEVTNVGPEGSDVFNIAYEYTGVTANVKASSYMMSNWSKPGGLDIVDA